MIDIDSTYAVNIFYHVLEVFLHIRYKLELSRKQVGAVVKRGSKPWKGVGENFAETFQKLIHYRGLEAERELISALTDRRVGELREGEEPRFGEILEIARILSVPLSTFQIFDRGDFPELEIAYADILYAAGEMSSEEREGLARRMSALVTPANEGDGIQHPSLLKIIKKQRDEDDE